MSYIFVSLLLLCFRLKADSIRPPLPSDVDMNKRAGCGKWLIIPVRLENGEVLPFMVDTGTPITTLDQSLEPKLGKCLTTATLHAPGSQLKSRVYAAPKLYLGNTQLSGDRYIATCDFRRVSAITHQRIMGVLGLDCLCHYCIQLDFQARKLRFLDTDLLNTDELGKAFPLKFSGKGQNFPQEPNLARPFINCTGLFGGTNTNLLVDTGDHDDGAVDNGVIKENDLTRFIHFLTRPGTLRLPECVWDGGRYTNLRVWENKNANSLGISFLARHLVTMDFPKRIMYLKQTSTGPLTYPDEGSFAAKMKHALNRVFSF